MYMYMYLFFGIPKMTGLVKKVGPFSKRKSPLQQSPYFRRKIEMFRAGRVLVKTETRFSKCPRKGLGRHHI